MMKDNVKKRNLTPEAQDRDKWSRRCRLLVNPDEGQALRKQKYLVIIEQLCLKHSFKAKQKRTCKSFGCDFL